MLPKSLKVNDLVYATQLKLMLFYRLHEEIDDFFKYITPTPTEIEARATVVNKITEIATELWPFAAVHTFGSYANGIYLPTR